MQFTGKRTGRLRISKQIRCDETMLRTIGLFAAEDCRDLNRETLYLLGLGIFHRQNCAGKEQTVDFRPMAVTESHSGSQVVTRKGVA